MGKKTRPFHMLSTRDPLQTERHRLKVKGRKKIFYANGNNNNKKLG